MSDFLSGFTKENYDGNVAQEDSKNNTLEPDQPAQGDETEANNNFQSKHNENNNSKELNNHDSNQNFNNKHNKNQDYKNKHNKNQDYKNKHNKNQEHENQDYKNKYNQNDKSLNDKNDKNHKNKNDFKKQNEVITANKSQQVPVKKGRSGAFADEEIVIDPTFHKQKLKKTIVICLTVLVMFFAMIALYIRSTYVSVVDYSGETIETAQKWAKENSIVADVESVISNDVASGLIIEQSVKSGERITKNSVIVYKVSEGPDLQEVVEVPNFKDKNEKDIKNFMNEKSIINAKIVYDYDDKVAKGNFLYTEFVEDGVNSKNYTRKDKVNFHVSNGKKGDDKKIKMPDYVNKKVEDTSEWATTNEILIEEKKEASDKPEGTILSQSVAKNELVAKGSTITFTISKGKGQSVPDFSGYNQTDAQTVAADAKVTVSVETKYSNWAPNGSLVSQSKAPGESFFEEDNIVLTYSLGKPFITDFTGSYENIAIDEIVAMNEQGANLSYHIIYQDSKIPDTPKGQVFKTAPYGQFVDTGSVITLYVQK